MMEEASMNPHGGLLVNQVVVGHEREEWINKASFFPKLVVSNMTVADLLCIATGAFSPLTGFMNHADYTSVLQQMRLANGLVWSLPIVLPIPQEKLHEIKRADYLALYRPDEELIAVMALESIYSVDLMQEARQVFQTDDGRHPGVARLSEQSNLYASGEIWLINRPDLGKQAAYAYDPKEMRQWFHLQGWKKIVGFQTRNPVHRAHEYIQKSALETMDGLLLHPLVGETKADDIPAEIRMRSYQVLLEKYYPQNRVKLGVFPAAMRYAGPKEAIFHALVRKNYGCTHFIVGRDHAGVGDFYGTYDAQRIFNQFTENELGITPLFFEHSFYCRICEGMTSYKTCPHAKEEHITLSGTKVREMLRTGQIPPPQFSRPEVAEILIQGFRKHEKV